MNKYYVYLLECKDKTYYCGYTTDIEKRLHTHNYSSRCAKYTRNRRPVVLKYTESFETKGEALKREYAIKQLTHVEKEKLINGIHT